MGFSTLLDIIGSTMIGGTILLILFRMNDSAVENHYLNSGELIVQTNLISVVELLEYDLRKIGYCQNWEDAPVPSEALLEATDTSISFLTDVSTTVNQFGDGNIDTLRYWVGSPNDVDVRKTPNPKDRMLYRQVNGEAPLYSNMGVTQLKIVYFDALGYEIPVSELIVSAAAKQPLGVITMQIDITVENTAAYGDMEDEENEVYSKDKSAFWRQIRLAAPSLNNR
ncbi:MAG: hypothetical protein IPH62_04900 [Ignavibacteriae bacterium]|nr:hypothetical protein [Ignavibacteriota bacterium]